MINLLPPEEKEKIFLENRKKLIVILGITIIIPLVCLVLMLISMKLYTSAQVNSERVNLEQAKKVYETPNLLTFKNTIIKNNSTIGVLKSFYEKETYITDVLKIILSLTRPPNLYVTNLSLIKDDKGDINITASGFSKSRDNLLVFQKNINANTNIKNPYFSQESWVDPENVTFYLTFEINK